MLRLILIAGLMAGFAMPSQVSAEEIGRMKIGAGIALTPDFGPVANFGYVVPFDDFYGLAEGTFERYQNSLSASFRDGTTDITMTTDVTSTLIGGNALGLYPYDRFYFFGGAGLVWASASVSVLGESSSSSSIKFNVIAGAGFHINESLFSEARWSHQGADLLVTIGFKIH